MAGPVAAGAVSWAAPDGEHPARRAGQRSMAAVAAGRKADWLSLFAPDALLEDPVGPWNWPGVPASPRSA